MAEVLRAVAESESKTDSISNGEHRPSLRSKSHC